MARFNVAEQPCVKLTFRSDADPEELAVLAPGAVPGSVRSVGLLTALTAAHLAVDVEVGNAAVESMIRRLLTALAARICGLDGARQDAWNERFDALLRAGRFDADEIGRYFTRWAHRFDLYDEQRPFLQDPRLAGECSVQAPPGRLVMPRASGNNQPWVDHTAQHVPVASYDALGWVLAWRGYGPSGTGAQRKHNGVNTKSMKAGPLRSLVSYHPLGENLFVSLLLSCPPPQTAVAAGADVPPWESDDLEDPLAPAPVRGPLSLLTGRTAHHVLLAADESGGWTTGCWVAWGTRGDLPAALDPFVIGRVGKEPERANHRRALLRDFDAFVHAKDPATAGIRGRILPQWLSVFADLPADVLDGLSEVRVRVLGCDQQKKPIESHWYTATTPASIAAYLPSRHPARAAQVATARQAAEFAASDLGAALRAAWRQMAPGDKDCPWADAASAAFWDRAEPVFWSAIDRESAPAAGFRSLALEVYDTATRPAATTPQGLHPIAKARADLAYPRRKKKA